MAVQGDKGQVLCEKCFAFMPAGSEFCTECGAPLTDAPGVDGSDAEVYPELAKANLHRMRKEFKPAEDICLSILRRFPNNLSANALLGDIAVEKGEMEQAVEWYELALDVVPDHTETQQKLDSARKSLADRQTQTTVEQLGIPTKSQPYGLYALAAVVIGAFVIAGVVLANRKPAANDDLNKPIVIKEDPASEPPKVTTKEEEEPVGAPEYKVDEALAAAIAAESGMDPARVLVVSVSSPGDGIRILLHSIGDDGEWPLRAKLVMASFKNKTASPKVEIQYAKSGEAKPESQIVERSTYEQTQAADFDQTNEALLVETLFGRKLVAEPPAEQNPEQGEQITPPIGDSGDRSSDDTAAGSGSTGN